MCVKELDLDKLTDCANNLEEVFNSIDSNKEVIDNRVSYKMRLYRSYCLIRQIVEEERACRNRIEVKK